MKGSLFTHAGPIWQELHLEFCTNGSIKSLQKTVGTNDSPDYGLVYQSYIPDLSLYYDNQLVNNFGAASTGPASQGTSTPSAPFRSSAEAATALTGSAT